MLENSLKQFYCIDSYYLTVKTPDFIFRMLIVGRRISDSTKGGHYNKKPCQADAWLRAFVFFRITERAQDASKHKSPAAIAARLFVVARPRIELGTS